MFLPYNYVFSHACRINVLCMYNIKLNSATGNKLYRQDRLVYIAIYIAIN